MNGTENEGTGDSLPDVAYVLGTIAFFAAMIAYGRACRALGRDQQYGEERS